MRADAFTRDQQAWLYAMLERIPASLRNVAERIHQDMVIGDKVREANIWLRETVDDMKPAPIIENIAIDAYGDEMAAAAELLADEYMDLTRARVNTNQKLIERAEREAGKQIPGDSTTSKVKRITDKKFWKGQIRKSLRLHRELWHLRLAPTRLKYCSTDATHEYQHMLAQNAEWAKAHTFVSDSGETFPAPTPTETQKKRYCQLVAQTKGIENIANERGMVAMIVTITLDTQYHATLTINPDTPQQRRIRNKNYDPALTPRVGHDWLNRQWGKLRKTLGRTTKKRGKIEFMDVVGVHPNGDETIHWHVVFWCYPDDVPEVENQFERYFRTNDNPRQIYFEKADSAHGASSYAMRMLAYVTRQVKNKDTENTEKKNRKNKKNDEKEALNASALASTMGIRRYHTSQTKTTMWILSRKDEISLPDEMKYSAVSGDYAGFFNAAERYGAKLKYVSKIGSYGDEYQKPVGIEFTDDCGNFQVSECRKVWTIEQTKIKIADSYCKEPSNDTPTPADEYFSEENMHVVQPNAPPMVLWNGESYPR